MGKNKKVFHINNINPKGQRYVGNTKKYSDYG